MVLQNVKKLLWKMPVFLTFPCQDKPVDTGQCPFLHPKIFEFCFEEIFFKCKLVMALRVLAANNELIKLITNLYKKQIWQHCPIMGDQALICEQSLPSIQDC